MDGSSDDAIAQCIADAMGERLLRLERQALAHSGNLVYRAFMACGRLLAVRISPEPQRFQHTRANLAKLHNAGLPVQTVHAQGITQTGGDFIVLDWLPGRDLFYVFDALDARQTQQLAEAVVETHCRVAQQCAPLPQSGFGWGALDVPAPLARWTDAFGEPASPATLAATLARADATPLERLRARLGLVRASLEDYFATLRPVCFLNDLTIKNVLVDHGEMSGLIDIDTVCYGDPLLVLGTTLAHIDALVGDRGRAYAAALLRCWAPQGERRRATGFYAAQWVLGFLGAALEQGNDAGARFLAPVADQLLRVGEGA
jgi:aminoglycoside phosphotransferase (APT) family kinase protein